MKKLMFTMTMCLSLMVLAVQQLHAQGPNCAPRPAVLAQLTEQFGESRQSIGLAAQGGVVEVFASANTRSWTITVTMPSGITCLIASGKSYEALAEVLPTAGHDA